MMQDINDLRKKPTKFLKECEGYDIMVQETIANLITDVDIFRREKTRRERAASVDTSCGDHSEESVQ